MNTIYNLDGQVIGVCKLGVAWSAKGESRLGSYDEGFVYDNEGEFVAKHNEGVVMDAIGETIGEVSGKNLIVDGVVVGKYVGSTGAGAAAIALLLGRTNTPT